MKCPCCEAEMNHHADKMLQSGERPGSLAQLGELVEVYCCPACGTTAIRDIEERPS